jgi:hypothetical protein
VCCPSPPLEHAAHTLWLSRSVYNREIDMARTDEYARTGLAAIALALLLPHTAFAGQISIHVSTPEIHVPPPKVHVSTPEFHTNRTNNLPTRNYTGVLQQQGRVTLQSDSGSKVSGKIRLDGRTTTVIDAAAKTTKIESASVAFLRNHPFNGGTPSGGNGTGWNELAALLGKDRIDTAFSLDPGLPTVFPGTGGGSFYSGVAPMPVSNPNAHGGYDTVNTVLVTPPNLPASLPVNYRDLWPVRLTLQGRLDSMNEMSEMTSMRLQMAMDRRSKFVETLSNMLKKIDKTQEAIIQNMK